jgi:AraC-like DNA-binding protein
MAAKPKAPLAPGIARDIVGPVADALRSLGVDPGDIGADLVVPGALADRLLDEAAARLGDPGLGITLAQSMPIGALGLLDYALCTSAIVRDALQRVADHYDVATQRVKLRLVDDEPSAWLVFERSPGANHSRHWIEFSLAIIAARIRQTLGRIVTFDRVSFVHPPPARTSAHDAFFGCDVEFGSNRDRLGFAPTLLDLSLRTASASLASLLDVKMRAVRPHEADTFLERVRDAVVALLDVRDVQLDSLAKRLAMTRRTVQRELERRDTSHQAIVDDVRRERALILLGEALTVTEVAERLAYSEPSAFFRAYRRLTGTSPRARTRE